MLNAGFQYLEQRDSNDTITKDGVVGKNSPFATSDNSGIYDIIAEDLRWLKENVDDVKDTSDLEAIKQSVTDMYNEMKNDSSFGEAAAKAQAEEAKKQAQAALESATNAKTYYDDITAKSTEVNDTIAEIKSYIEKAEALNASNKELEQSISDSATVATNKAKSAANSASNAATSAEHAKTSETNAKTSETNAKVSETNAAKSESNAKAHMDATATSEVHAKTSETNAKASQTASKTSENNAKTSETNAKQYSINSSNSADLARAWAESSDSPDSVNDTDSTTGKTQSSKTWAIYSKDRAISAFKSETNAKASETAAKTSETNAKTSETNAATSASNAATSESHAKTSETNAKVSETNAKTSETNASTSKSNAATSETNAKSYMDTAKEYMQKAQEALAAAQAIQSIVDTAKANAEKCLADVEAVRDSLAKMITYQGSVDNYSDLPTNPQVGYSYNVKNADKEHGVNAGDNLVWNGEDWDNFGSFVDMSLFAELGKDVKFNTVTATTFTGNLNGNADSATNADTVSNQGSKTAIKDGTWEPTGLNLYKVYDNGYPCTYGNLLSIGGAGGGELLAGWSGANHGIEHLYYRNRRDSGSLWSDWRTIAFITDINNYAPTKTGGGASGTWGISISGNAATATKADAVKSDSVTDSSTVARPVWLSYENDNTRQVVTPSLAYTPSTKTLETPNFKGHLHGTADGANIVYKAIQPRGVYGNNNYIFYGTLTIPQNGDFFKLDVLGGSGHNSETRQSREGTLYFRTGNGNPANYAAYSEYHRNGAGNFKFFVVKDSGTQYRIYSGLTEFTGTMQVIPYVGQNSSFDLALTSVSALPDGAVEVEQQQLIYASSNIVKVASWDGSTLSLTTV